MAHTWPVLKSYAGDYLNRIALPLGGIGTGTVSLGGRGQLQDWELYDRPAKGFNGQSLAVLYACAEGQAPICRALEGVLPTPYEGPFGSTAAYHGLPRMRGCTFEAAYPFGQVALSDPDIPLQVRLQAFNPFIPADAERSGLPIAFLRYQLTNPGTKPVQASIAFSLRNFIGNSSGVTAGHGNRNEYRDTGSLRGIYLQADDLDSNDEFWGSLALCTPHRDVSHQLSWGLESFGWGSLLLHYWDDLLVDGRLDPIDSSGLNPIGSMAASCTVAPGASEELVFILGWHFPNRMTWSPAKEAPGEGCACGSCGCKPAGWVGNYYATRYKDAWDAAESAYHQLETLERDTLAFTGSFLDADLLDQVKEAALFNLSTLRSQTCFRTADGRFYGWEGCGDAQGCCPGSCTHVWNYEQATAFLFGGLACSMREVEFAYATSPEGLMHFRVPLPLGQKPDAPLAAADGQMGCILKMYRDWQLAGDTIMLRSLWPQVKAALSFAWLPGGWDADQDGVMEGCQHNTLDVEYYGPNGLMAGWYLGALRAGEEMATALGDDGFAVRCRELYARGSAWVDAHLFNGEYYEQVVEPAAGETAILPGLRSSMGALNLQDPDYQVGAGCLVDQLVGQLLAHICGLGHLLDAGHIQTALESIARYNGQADLYGHFNHLRTFALNDESALLMVSYPHGNRPRTPVPYFNEVMTGFEYAAAVHMLYEGLTEQGLQAIANIRARYDGKRRNPFDEAECGHHYARAMCSWAAVLAMSGFHYSAVTGEMRFARRPGRHFWSTGYAWGTCEISSAVKGWRVILHVNYGSLFFKQLA
ncbi:MAG: GH116 family glycosyl-hydrolase, partial [Anaerolineae bacterium]